MTVAPSLILSRYLEAVSNLDADALVALLADDAAIQSALMPGELSDPVRGKPVLEGMYRAFLARFEYYAWESIEIIETRDPTVVVARASSTARLRNGGAPYANRYAFFQRVRDGLIVESIEYFDPVAAARVFA